MFNPSAYGAGLLNQTQFGKVTSEIGNIQGGVPQPMARTSPVGNIVGGLTGTQMSPTTQTTTTSANSPSTINRPYAGSNPVTNAQAVRTT